MGYWKGIVDAWYEFLKRDLKFWKSWNKGKVLFKLWTTEKEPGMPEIPCPSVLKGFEGSGKLQWITCTGGVCVLSSQCTLKLFPHIQLHSLPDTCKNLECLLGFYRTCLLKKILHPFKDCQVCGRRWGV